MTHVAIITTDGGTLYTLQELTETEAESLAMFLAITDSLNWHEAVIDIANWQTRFRHTLAKELPGLLPGVIRSRHGGKVPGTVRARAKDNSVRSRELEVTINRRDENGIDWFDVLIRAEGTK